MWRALSLALALLPAVAAATAIDVSLRVSALAGKELPALSVHILEPIAGFEVKLKRSDGQPLDVKGGGRPGVTRVVELKQPEGRFSWEGEVQVNLPDGSSESMPLKFETEAVGRLVLTIDKDKDIDVAGRKVAFRINHAIDKAHLRVLMDTGKTAFDGDVPFNGAPADTRLELTWPEAKGREMQISIRAFDTAGFHAGQEFFPWFIDVPHDEVVFDTGKADIREDQRTKLDAAYEAISSEVDKYGEFAPVKLFILGHTDTQGDPASNRVLSNKRARSIGAYFRKRRLRIPVMAEGFGEEALKVRTADETDEPRNRRADYRLSIEPPQLSNAPFTPKWQKL